MTMLTFPTTSPTLSTSGATPLGSLLSGSTSVFGMEYTDIRRGKEVLSIIEKGYWVKATGSRVTTHFTDKSDYDYVIFDPDGKLEVSLMYDGWELGGSGDKGELTGRAFSSLKKGGINFILVSQESQWKKWVVATNLLKAINPKTKEERIKLFDTVFGNTPDSRAMEFGDPF